MFKMSFVALPALSLIACSEHYSHGRLSDVDFSAFDRSYTVAKSGGKIDCNALISAKVIVPPSEHMQKSHGAEPDEVGLLDYIAATGNDFAKIGACTAEISSAVQRKCEEVDQMIAEVEAKNATSNGVLHGVLLSGSALYFCSNKTG